MAMPGQALAYMVGRLELVRLRERAGARLGEPVRPARLPRPGARHRRVPLSVLAEVVDGT